MKTLKKLSAILLSVMILATLIPANFAFAATTFTPEYYDFEDYTDASGKAKPAGFGMGGNGATMKPDSDEKYGTTVKIEHTATSKGPNLNKGLAVGLFPASGILTIRTALKMDNKLANNGILFANVVLTYFGKDGYIYIAGTKTSYTYDINTWYDVAVTFNKTTGYAEAVINGGAYKNLVISGYSDAIKNMSITGNYVYSAIGSNIEQSSNSYGAAFEIGYLSLYEGVFVTPSKSFKDDFEDGSAGAYSATDTGSASIAADGDNNVLKVVNNDKKYLGAVKRIITLPDSGSVEIGFLAKGATNTQRFVQLTGDGANSETAYLVNFLVAKDNATSAGTNIGGSDTNDDGTKIKTWSIDKWYKVVLTFDMTAKKYSGEIYDVDGNFSVGSKSGIDMPTINGNPCLMFNTNGTLNTAGSNPAYYDDIYVKVEENIRLQHVDIAPGTTNVFVSEEPTVYFTEEIDPETVNTANVTLTADGVTTAYTPEVGADGKSIVIKHTELLAGEKTYTVTVSNIAAKDNSTDVADSYTYSFTTAKAYELGAVSFGGATGALGENVTATVSIKFNDDVAHEVAFITAVYDKESGELVACDIDNRKEATAVEGSADLSATVTIPDVAGKTYEVYAYLWDGFATLRPYIAATPLA